MRLLRIPGEKEGREGKVGSALSVTRERGEEALSPDNKEKGERNKRQSRKQPPRPEFKIPTLEGVLGARP